MTRNNQFKIIFKGELLTGFNITEVKQPLKQQFNIDATELEQLFSGETVVLKKNMTVEQATKYHGKFQALGLLTYIEEASVTKLMEISPVNSTQRAESSQETIKTPSSNTIAPKNVTNDNNTEIEAPSIFGFDFSSGLTLSARFTRFNCKGRYGRINFANAYMIFNLAFIAYEFINEFIFEYMLQNLGRNLNILILLLNLFIIIIFVVLIVRIIILRLHDINLSAWWLIACFFVFSIFAVMYFLAILLPALGSRWPHWLTPLLMQAIFILLLIVLMIIPGSKGQNNYGLPVKRGNLLVFYIGLFLHSLPILFLVYGYYFLDW